MPAPQRRLQGARGSRSPPRGVRNPETTSGRTQGNSFRCRITGRTPFFSLVSDPVGNLSSPPPVIGKRDLSVF